VSFHIGSPAERICTLVACFYQYHYLNLLETPHATGVPRNRPGSSWLLVDMALGFLRLRQLLRKLLPVMYVLPPVLLHLEFLRHVRLQLHLLAAARAGATPGWKTALPAVSTICVYNKKSMFGV
jgi:hypothetical protein